VSARDDIRVPFGLAFAMANRPVSEVDELLDEYEAVHHNEVLFKVVAVLGAETFWHDPRDRAAAMEAVLRMASTNTTQET